MRHSTHITEISQLVSITRHLRERTFLDLVSDRRTGDLETIADQLVTMAKSTAGTPSASFFAGIALGCHLEVRRRELAIAGEGVTL